MKVGSELKRLLAQVEEVGCHQMSRPLRVGEKTHRCALDWSTVGTQGETQSVGARPDYVAGAVSEQSCKRLTVAGETWITLPLN